MSTQAFLSDLPDECLNAPDCGDEAYGSHQSPNVDTTSSAAIVAAVHSFLQRLPYRHPNNPQNVKLRREISDEIVSWNTGLSADHIEQITDTSCGTAECTYAHTGYEHQRFVALYTACLTFVDDLGYKNIELVGEFVQRFTRGQPQPLPALSRLQGLLAEVYDYCPRVSADAIVTSTMDGISGMYTELITKGYIVQPEAVRYPYHLRIRTGIAVGYAHLTFTKEWARDAGHMYLQVVPEVEAITVGFNDILSFYKETLVGDTGNYIHMRATAERRSPLTVLEELIEENLDSARKIKKFAASQTGLTEICHSSLMGYIEFHLNARRYHLEGIVDGTRYLPAS
ncbi:hypothetical protein ONZ51_g3892 [Trametes cubensis]|uniref:Terpenoid synthase n=1 Tax=Trametes cubensis TaxID=1111947 RepID=A0AAD7XAR8_9APHY|nr:hypothetical protein ONZ51_g3892 [Trametes cubensis]